MARPFSLAHLTVIELDPPAVVSCAAAAGYDMADLRLFPVVPSDVAYPLAEGSPMLREVLARLDDTGLRILDVELIRLRAGIDLRDYERLFATGRRLGARYVKVACLEDDEGLAADLIAEAAALADPHGLTIDLEFMVFTGVKTFEAACRVVKASGAPNAAVLVDSLHLDRSGGTPAAVAAADPALIAYLHISDAPAALPPTLDAIVEEARSTRLIPGEGGLPLVDLVAAMPRDCPVSVELPMKDWAARAPAAERARIMLDGARRVVAQAEALRGHDHLAPDRRHVPVTVR